MTNKKQNVIAFIPVRGSSKSIKKKNIRPFCGRPLVYWVINAAESSNTIDRIIVATEDRQIKDAVMEMPFKKVQIYNRSHKNTQDTSSTESVMLEYIEIAEPDNDDILILIQATSPFTQKEDIDRAFALMKDKQADSLLTCARIKKFLWEEDGTPINYDIDKRPFRQNFNGQLIENGAFYINNISNIKKFKNRLSGNICVYEMPEYTTIELDEEIDWVMAEAVMRETILPGSKTMKHIKLVLTDVDGVLTDAGMYYTEKGDEIKKFNTHDGKAFELLKKAGLMTGIITSENTAIVEKRGGKLKIDFIKQGVADKLPTVKTICKKMHFNLSEVAYIGDDINDLELLNAAGVKACPFNANKKIKYIDDIIVLNKCGGEGVFREFVDLILGL